MHNSGLSDDLQPSRKFGSRWSLHAVHILSMPWAAIAQLGERQTEDLKVPGSIPGLGTFILASVAR